ncbi:hypothetical protein ACFLXK_02100 [Chloroflexota bacterium]
MTRRSRKRTGEYIRDPDVKKRICWTLLDLIEGLPRTERQIGEGQVGFLKAFGAGKLVLIGDQELMWTTDRHAAAEGDRQLRDSIRGAKRLAWELWLVYDHLDKLSNIGWQGNIVEMGRRFKRLYESEHLRELANSLDHAAAERARGLDNDFEVQGGGEGHVQSIKVFGKQYRVREVIDSALELRAPLQTFMASI